MINKDMSIVNLTDSAKDYLKSVGKPNVSLSINSGGCSGFTYLWDTTVIPPIPTQKHDLKD